MIRKSLIVLLIEDSPDYAELVQRWLSPQNGVEFVLNWTDSLRAGLSRLAQGGVDAVLLDLGLPDSDGLETFTTIKAQASGVPIVILSAGETESLALEMVREGAQDYIIKTSCNSEVLVKALQFALGRSSHKTSEPTASDQWTVIGVLGVKGGVGVTTFACNLSMELRRQTNQGVLLADLDVNAHLIPLLMKPERGFSMQEAIANIHRLDRSLWEGLVAHGKGGVDILRSHNVLGGDDADVCKIQNVLALIRKFYRWTVLDLGRMTGRALSLIDKVSELHLITTVSIASLHEAKMAVRDLMKAGLETDRLRLVVNQIEGTGQLSGSELQQLFGLPLYANIPDAARELDDAFLKGELLGETSGYQTQIANVARKTAGLPEEASGGRVSQLRAFAHKFRRNGKPVVATPR